MTTAHIRAAIPATDPRVHPTVDMTAAECERITDRVLADESVLAVQDLVDVLTHLRWCFACRAANIGGGARGGCRACIAFVAGVRLIAKAKAVRS